ncbi:MAG: alpha/beta hydrolase [Pseudomonadales bacterium]|nr:alpha/beta hydrolase [Pseudomonadales bacterium]
MEMIQLKDGRILAYESFGDENGVPVFFSHGLSDSRLIRNPDDELTASLCARWITVDQPGVGGSSPKRNRTLRDWAFDIEQLADALGIDKFAVAGHSGGGPHALAIASFLSHRVTHGVLAAPIAPFSMTGFSQMLPVKSLGLLYKLKRPRFILRGLLNLTGWWANRNIGAYIDSVATMDRTDQNTDTFRTDPALRAMFEKSFSEGFKQGGEGLIEMVEALWNWGFTLADVHAHFELFHGDLDNALSPKMGEAIVASMPDANFNLWKNTGHYGFVERTFWTEFIKAAVKSPSD